jgi:hypothetical protein
MARTTRRSSLVGLARWLCKDDQRLMDRWSVIAGAVRSLLACLLARSSRTRTRSLPPAPAGPLVTMDKRVDRQSEGSALADGGFINTHDPNVSKTVDRVRRDCQDMISRPNNQVYKKLPLQSVCSCVSVGSIPFISSCHITSYLDGDEVSVD